MKKIIFFSLPAHGHTNPTLNVARELVKSGNKVIYYSTEEFRKKIEAAGISYRSYNPKYFFDGRISRNIGLFARKLVEVSEYEVPHLLEDVQKEKPDCIAHDTLSLWGKVVGNALQIPTISLFTTFAFNNKVAAKYPEMYIPLMAKTMLRGHHTISAFTKYRKLCKRYGLKPGGIYEFFLTREDVNIVFTSAYFQPCADSFNKTFKFVGASLFPRDEKADFIEKLDKTKKLIYISIGTVFNGNLPFFHLCIDAFKNTEYQVILSLGHRFSFDDLPQIPENIIVRNHIPQLEVLQKADVFITHGGMNSITESLYYGVPMVVIPQIHEQILNALRIQDLGAGVYIKNKKVNKKTVIQSVEKVLQTKSYYENALKIQKGLKESGGYKKAAEEILQFSNANQ